MKNSLVKLKLDPQNIELKEQIKYRIFRSKNTYSANARTYKNITKSRTIKNKTIYNMTNTLKTDLELLFLPFNLLSSTSFLLKK